MQIMVFKTKNGFLGSNLIMPDHPCYLLGFEAELSDSFNPKNQPYVTLIE